MRQEAGIREIQERRRENRSAAAVICRTEGTRKRGHAVPDGQGISLRLIPYLVFTVVVIVRLIAILAQGSSRRSGGMITSGPLLSREF
jgi:hypothetical protein